MHAFFITCTYTHNVHVLEYAEIFPFCTPFALGFSVSPSNCRGRKTFPCGKPLASRAPGGPVAANSQMAYKMRSATLASNQEDVCVLINSGKKMKEGTYS